LTVVGMRSTEEKVALQAIEFWSTVCEEETELLIEAAEVRGCRGNDTCSNSAILGR
jgi:importin subunit beta-1